MRRNPFVSLLVLLAALTLLERGAASIRESAGPRKRAKGGRRARKLQAGNTYNYSGDDVRKRFVNIVNNKLNNLNYQYPFPLPPDDCNLSAEVFPLYYTPIIRSATLRVAFASNCMTKRDINFEMSFQDNEFVNWIYHPTVIYLNLWKNVYRLDFSLPKVIDRFDVFKSLEYRSVDVNNMLNGKRTLDLTRQNQVYLHPQDINSFNRFNVAKLVAQQTAVQCSIRTRKMQNLYQITMRKNAILDSLRKLQGFTEEEIKALYDRKMAEVLDPMVDPEFVDTPPVPPPTVDPNMTAAEQAAVAFEAQEEAFRLDKRNIVLAKLKKEFIWALEVECQIN